MTYYERGYLFLVHLCKKSEWLQKKVWDILDSPRPYSLSAREPGELTTFWPKQTFDLCSLVATTVIQKDALDQPQFLPCP
jgi:hypothetical protein